MMMMKMYTNQLLRRRFSYLIPIYLNSQSSSSFTYHFTTTPTFSSTTSHNFSHKLLCRMFTSDNSTRFRNCWNCDSISKTTEPFLVCESCRCVQPLDPSIDYFHIFTLERKYDIEDGSLEGKYKDWQKKLHPDLVHSKSESERQYAAEQSARVIDAYRTLNNSLSRAMYLMKLQGLHVEEEQTVSDPNLLAEIMEIRESIEDADSQGLNQLQTQVHEKMKQWSESFASAFKSQNTEEAINAIRRMTYYKRAMEEITNRL